MYKVSSDRRQSALHRGQLRDWIGGHEYQSATDQLDSLVRADQNLQLRIKALPHGEERQKLGIERQALCAQIKEQKRVIGVIKVARDGYERLFIDLAREMLLPHQYKAISSAAIRQYDKAKEAAEATLSALERNDVESKGDSQ